MSGIAGIFYFDGQPVDRSTLERMGDVLAHRGPDNQGLWYQRPVGLVHRMLRTTPESLQEQLPLVSTDGMLAITADARIDNRDELISALGLADHVGRAMPDSALILATYEQWGESCPKRLLGDFAFVIWDGRKEALFCARDHFGVKPFYYYRSSRFFVFASEIKGLLCLPEVPRHLNEVRVGEYLVPMVEDKTITFYEDILRLAPAHSMVVSREGGKLERYWSLDPSRELYLGSDDEYAEAFRELFAETVRCRLRSAFPVGSQLSGGLDSSSVTCMARELYQGTGSLLHTFSAVFDQVKECDERPYIEEVLAQGNLESCYTFADQIGPLNDMERMFWHQDEPFAIPNLFMNWAMLSETKACGVRVLLDGMDGDTTVSHGDAYLGELAQLGEWAGFAEELRAFAQVRGISPWPYLEYYGLSHLRDLLRRGRWEAYGLGVREIANRYDVSWWNLTLNHGLKRLLPKWVTRVGRGITYGRNRLRNPDQASPGLNPIIRRDFARRIGLGERHRQYDRLLTPARTERAWHHRRLNMGVHPFSLEVCDRASAAFGVESRHPFYDRRLAEFCLSLPPQQKLHQGWERLVMRRAMQGILPPQVQWRADKSRLSPNFLRGLLTFERERMDHLILHHSAAIQEYMDVDVLRQRYSRFVTKPTTSEADTIIWPVVSLGLWLDHVGFA